MVGLDEPVELADGSAKPLINFDNAATTPPLKPVADTVEEEMKMYGSIGRGFSAKSNHSTDIYMNTRQKVMEFVNADPDINTCVYANSTTDGLNKLASALIESEDDLVLATRMEHHADDLPWRERCHVIYAEVDEQGRIIYDDIERLLEENDGKVKYVCVTAASNVTGYITDVHRVAKMAHEHGAMIIVDGAQIVAHRQFSMKGETPEEDIDFFIFSAHKMYSPYGGGAIVGPWDVLDRHMPEFYGGGTVKIVRDEQVVYKYSPESYEAGSPNYAGVVGMGKAMDILKEVGFDAIEEHEKQLNKRLIEGLKKFENVIIYGDSENIDDRVGVVSFNFSDVNSNPANPIIGVRSFSDDPAVVSEYVRSFIKGLRSAGISSALKHFPGHGNVGEDSHTGLPCSDFSLDEIKKCDLVPFQAGIDEGTDMIMTAHIQFPQIEKETYISTKDGKEVNLPATLSHTIIHDILREEMGYDGIVITDSMVMDAIAAHFDPTDAAVLAINAGVDILLCPVDLYKDGDIDTFPNMETYMNSLLKRVEAGDISQEELDDSVYRILKLKKDKGIFKDVQLPSVEEQSAAAKAAVGSAENHAREWEIAQLGMTLLKNENNALPVESSTDTLILYPSKTRAASVEYAIKRLEKEGLADPARITAMCYADLSADDQALQDALANADNILILSQSVYQNPEIVKVIDQAETDGKNTILLSLNLPYDAACYENTDAVLCAFQPYGSAHDEEGNGPFNLNVAVAVCMAFNQSVPSGRLPVNVPKVTVNGGEIVFEDDYLYERGFSLENWGD